VILKTTPSQIMPWVLWYY